MVTSPGKGALIDNFTTAPALERFLIERDKRDLLGIVRQTSGLARITPVEQTQPLGIGHAVLQAKAAVGNEPFAVILPDDISIAKRRVCAN